MNNLGRRTSMSPTHGVDCPDASVQLEGPLPSAVLPPRCQVRTKDEDTARVSSCSTADWHHAMRGAERDLPNKLCSDLFCRLQHRRHRNCLSCAGHTSTLKSVLAVRGNKPDKEKPTRWNSVLCSATPADRLSELAPDVISWIRMSAVKWLASAPGMLSKSARPCWLAGSEVGQVGLY